MGDTGGSGLVIEQLLVFVLRAETDWIKTLHFTEIQHILIVVIFFFKSGVHWCHLCMREDGGKILQGVAFQFKMAQKRLKAAEGGLLVDVSCGSGLFSRRFAKCGYYSGVVALDFSENMLRQCYEFVKQDRSLSTMNLALVRADVARLPFATSSVDAVHAGAALHCWPSLSSAV
eukprot:Gb_14255 [translate_table: standard]